MKIVESLEELRVERAKLQGPVAFVPTMGALHAGHGSLISAAATSGARVVVSIYVNPTQFEDRSDFSNYPKTFEADRELCAAGGVDILWVPKTQELYPDSAETSVQVGRLENVWEGESRPGHFRGVATVVTKLFLCVQPDVAYFGCKDLQQLFVVKALVRDLLFPITIRGVDTFRESNGLAMSSRNERLSDACRDKAGQLYRSLCSVRSALSEGSRKVRYLREIFMKNISELESVEVLRCDFLSSDLKREYSGSEEISSGYLAVAIRYDGVRLIDNIEL